MAISLSSIRSAEIFQSGGLDVELSALVFCHNARDASDMCQYTSQWIPKLGACTTSADNRHVLFWPKSDPTFRPQSSYQDAGWSVIGSKVTCCTSSPPSTAYLRRVIVGNTCSWSINFTFIVADARHLGCVGQSDLFNRPCAFTITKIQL